MFKKGARAIMHHEIHRVPKQELEERMRTFRAHMHRINPSWRMVMIHHKINMYYLTGTMQEGVLIISPDSAILWVRRNYERACQESLFADIRPMGSFRTIAAFYTDIPHTIYLETANATLEWMNLVKKYIPLEKIENVQPILADMRAVKSTYELDCMHKAGQIHEQVLGSVARTLVHEGVSEAELAVQIMQALLIRGGHGIARFNQPLAESVIGYASFGESSLHAAAFDGPGGTIGTCVAVQSIGSHMRKLTRNSLIYLDIPSGVEGYHTDKTTVLYFGDLSTHPQGERIRQAYAYCQKIEREIAQKLVPGAVPEEVYQQVMCQIDPAFAQGFMNGARFLGHSVGLTVDETPVIAKGFSRKLEANMTFAIEPKIALEGIGVVGTENTYHITAQGAVSLTGTTPPLIEIK